MLTFDGGFPEGLRGLITVVLEHILHDEDDVVDEHRVHLGHDGVAGGGVEVLVHHQFDLEKINIFIHLCRNKKKFFLFDLKKKTFFLN